MYNELKNVVRIDLPMRFNEFDLLKTYFSRIINLFEGNILPPYEILIHPSSICNLNCEWCIGSFVANKKTSSKLISNNLKTLNNMKRAIDSIISYKKQGKNYITNKIETFGVENVSFSGITGEPFMSKESILYAIDTLSKHGIRVGVFTNGVMIEPDMYDTVLKMGYLLISLDAGTAETYSKLKCLGKNNKSFYKVIKMIEELNIRKTELHSTTDINIGYVVNQYNYLEIYEIAKKLKSIGVHYLRFKTDIASLMNMTDDVKKIAKTCIERAKKELTDDYFTIVEIHDVLDSRKKTRHFEKCFIHYLIGNISADGNVYPCNYHPKPNGYYYDSAIDKDFSDVWNNLKSYSIDEQLPAICPAVCDPFKNRANKLLEVAYDIYVNKGIDYLKKCIEKVELDMKEANSD